MHTRSLGDVSVVMNARAAASHAVKLWLRAVESGPCGWSTVRILEIGRTWSMTPVDITSVSEEDGGDDDDKTRASVARAMAPASVRPWQPMTTLAQPLLTMRARARPRVCLRTSLETIMGAAWNTLHVKLAAADVWRQEEEDERRTVRSRAEASFFMPLCTPPTR